MRPNARRAVEFLHDLIGFDTVSRNSNLALISYVSNYLATLGIDCELIRDETGTKANLFATAGGPAGVPGIVLSGHTDVVPVEGQDWATDPFTLTERDGKLFGPGTPLPRHRRRRSEWAASGSPWRWWGPWQGRWR